MRTFEEFHFIIRLIFVVLLLPFPREWHTAMFSTMTLCYIKRQLPLTPSGDLDLALLDRLNWGLLPIEQLWPVIRDHQNYPPLLQEHCHEFSYDQILWIAKNDPLNRVLLLTNHECMLKVSFSCLDLEDFQSHFLELPIYSISDLESVFEEIIVDGLQRISYHFPSRQILEDFLSRLPVQILRNPQILADFRALTLFSVDYLFKEPSRILAYTKFLFRMRWAFKTPLWKVSILQLADLVETIPASVFVSNFILKRCHRHIQDDSLIRQFLSNSESGELYFSKFRLFRALILRDASFFTSIAAFIKNFGHDIGAFDQYRLVSTLLPNNLAIFNDYFEADIFDYSLLETFFASKPQIFDKILPLAPPKLLRFLSLRPSKPHEAKLSTPYLIDRSPCFLDFHQIIMQNHIQSKCFHRRDFRIRYAHDVVVDLGGPLQDWITEIIQRTIDLGLFSSPVGFEAEARDFLDVRIFKLLGLMHGKLIQVGSGPAWIPSIPGTLLENISALIHFKSDPAEAVRLFNEFRFPNINDPVKDRPFRVCCHAEIQLYLTRIRTPYNTWRDGAWEQYYNGLSVFIVDQIPRPMIIKLLGPLEPVNAAQIASKTHIQANPDISYDLSDIWLEILESLSPEELVKLLIFITGQSQLTRFSVHFIIVSEGRLPTSRTCFQKLFLYPKNPISSQQLLTAALTESLRNSISNYQGFGNV